jgi:penicillin-binding protein 1A
VRIAIKLLLTGILAGAGLALAVVAIAIPVEALVRHSTSSTPNILSSDINTPTAEQSTVYAADGSVLAYFRAATNRIPVTIDQVPADVINAVLDVEDARYWTHGAIDVKSAVRSFASDVKAGGVREGGSTITQQLVKNLFLSPKRNLSRKFKEAVIATRLEKKYTKRQILQAYLNIVYFGNGAYGVQSAAQTYFNEDISQVTPVQAALLASLISNPSGYDPVLNPAASTFQRNVALDQMAHYSHLTQAQATDLKATPVPTAVFHPQGTADTKDDYYVEAVKQYLLNQSTVLGSTYTQRYNELFEGGLKIYTNLDTRLQDLAEQKVAAGVPTNTQGFTAALASVEPGTGKVRAIVGGPGFDTNKFDLATQAYRQPGSGFKLFTLLAAYEAGYGPNDPVDGSSPCAIAFPGDTDYLKKPANNAEGNATGYISVLSATANSVNCAFIRLAHEVTLPKVIEMAHRLGLSENFTPVPSIVIGSEGVTVLDMASAYATLAADGVYHAPSFVDHIVDANAKTIYREDTPGKRVLSPQISRLAVSTLRAVVEFGTGTGANLYDREVAGKTGTTEQNTDAWFNGFAPQLATSVWMGDPKGRTPMYDVGGITVFGGTYPASIWHAYTEAALQGQPDIPFPNPDQYQIPAFRVVDSPGLEQDTGSNSARAGSFPGYICPGYYNTPCSNGQSSGSGSGQSSTTTSTSASSTTVPKRRTTTTLGGPTGSTSTTTGSPPGTKRGPPTR